MIRSFYYYIDHYINILGPFLLECSLKTVQTRTKYVPLISWDQFLNQKVQTWRNIFNIYVWVSEGLKLLKVKCECIPWPLILFVTNCIPHLLCHRFFIGQSCHVTYLPGQSIVGQQSQTQSRCSQTSWYVGTLHTRQSDRRSTGTPQRHASGAPQHLLEETLLLSPRLLPVLPPSDWTLVTQHCGQSETVFNFINAVSILCMRETWHTVWCNAQEVTGWAWGEAVILCVRNRRPRVLLAATFILHKSAKNVKQT